MFILRYFKKMVTVDPVSKDSKPIPIEMTTYIQFEEEELKNFEDDEEDADPHGKFLLMQRTNTRNDCSTCRHLKREICKCKVIGTASKNRWEPVKAPDDHANQPS